MISRLTALLSWEDPEPLRWGSKIVRNVLGRRQGLPLLRRVGREQQRGQLLPASRPGLYLSRVRGLVLLASLLAEVDLPDQLNDT